MAQNPTNGACHICGVMGKLSFERVPLRSAYNDRPLVLQRIDELLAVGPDSRRGRVCQRGAGA
jgi:hypothetical protein